MKSRTRVALTSLLVLLFSAVALVPFSDARVAGISKGARLLQKNVRTAVKVAEEVLSDTAGGASAPVVVLLADQADVSAAHDMKDQDARGWFVYDTLTQHAQRTQAGLRGFLDSQGVGYQSYWAANMMVVTADRRLVESLAARDDVARIDSNRPARWIEDPVVAISRRARRTRGRRVGRSERQRPGGLGHGVQRPGHRHRGPGHRHTRTHAAIRNHYRGWNGINADHNYNWHDAIHSGGGSCELAGAVRRQRPRHPHRRHDFRR